ncbi:MAG TPA: hypothetical protein VFD90_12435 [Gaiellales bacterium]|jgi:hypothetical protein|nr:hypothetical protein [Gaiellales bacterium]
MAGKADFTDEEWHLVVQGPPTAGMIVVTAQRGGTFRETISIARSYVEARQQHHGESELLDEIVSARPELDRTRAHSPEELREHGLQHLRDAVALVEAKAPGEAEAYRRFSLGLANKVADAHRERGNDQAASEAERAAIAEIETALGTPSG